MKNNPTEYWKGLEELHHEEEFEKQINNEFAEKLPIGKVINDDDLGLTSNRRDFLKFMGFGIGAATLAACSHSPVRKAVPFVNKPVDVDAGIPELYASTCSGCNANCSILVKTRDGRPIKIEGNDESPFNKGGVCAVGQSTVLSLYDSGRLSHPVKGGKASDWKTIDADVMAALKSATGVRVLTGTINSPTTQAVIDDFCKKYNAKHIQYDASSVYALREAHNASFGKTVTPNYMIDKAKVLVSFGADFLGTWISPVEYTKAYSASRKSTLKKEDFLYHVQFESNLSLTGSNADMRVTLSPSQYGQALVRLHNLIAGYAGASAAGNSSLELGGNSIEHTAKALWKSKGKALVICGSNDVNHQVLVASINSMLDSYGNTIDIDNPSYQNMGNDKDMIGLVAEMNAGKVDVLILHDVNPVYTYPDQKAFVSGWGKVKTTVNLATRLDETADKSTHVAPNSHGLESWGDAMPKAGYISLIQPTISTIFSTRQTEESLLTWMETPMAYDEYLKKNWKKTYYNTKDSFDDYWEKCLEMGFITTETSTAGSHAFKGDASAAATEALKTTSGKGLEIVTYEKLSIKDGKNANNPWLQELPDPVSKVSWDNYAAMS
ncbi:MAG: TAT-variant-translocated molybdopterin oxidoreductase, partial [Bacteroidetes bacterium]|nr:TAT-variant-translocated molybdopterin oxidoreductase [Bacteroidota bacterium]